MAYKCGRRPPKNAPALSLASFLVRPVPTHPSSEDYLARLNAWKMLGNDVAGDCNAVAWANMRRLITATLSSEYYPTQAQVWQFYETQNPLFDPQGTSLTNGPGSSADQGMALGREDYNGQQYEQAAVAFAKVDQGDVAQVEAALAIFGGIWLGITVLDANQQEFANDQAWTDVPGSPIDGGHAILGGGYTPDVKFITWAQETQFAPSFWSGSGSGAPLVEEAGGVIWPEHLGSKAFLSGVDLQKLAADYLDLTGETLILPA